MVGLVLLHGFTGRGDSWREVISLVPDPWQTVTPELLGHGPEDPGRQVESFAGEVDRLAGLIRTGEFAPCHLVGYSLGGRLALGLALRHPELVARLTLVGAHPGLALEAERDARRSRDETWARMLEEEGLEPFLEAWERQPLFASQGRLPEERRVAQRRLRRSHHAEGLARALRILGLANMPGYRPLLGSMTQPVQLVVGELDAKFRGLAQEMHDLLPTSTCHLIPGVGHNVLLEAPEVLADLLQEAAG
jgi:2-succinyl-6-hydroxy-2,4-cyclohexadiene-1-carboxylate synthase